jgi:hypothetical protein
VYPFLSKQCPAGATTFSKTNCVGPRIINMGYWVNGGSIGNCDASGTVYGNYYLEANASPLYNKKWF